MKNYLNQDDIISDLKSSVEIQWAEDDCEYYSLAFVDVCHIVYAREKRHYYTDRIEQEGLYVIEKKILYKGEKNIVFAVYVEC